MHKKFHLNCIRYDLFETPWIFLGKWTNSNIHLTVSDGPFSAEIFQGCTFNPKMEIPYWNLAPALSPIVASVTAKGSAIMPQGSAIIMLQRSAIIPQI